MRARSIAAVFVAVLLVGSLASCSKKDSGSSDDAAVKTEETDESTTTEDTSSSDDPASSDESSSDASTDDITGLLGDCGQAYIVYSSLIASSAGLMGGATDEQIKELEDQADKLRDEVPEDLQDDMLTVADAYKEFAAAIGDGGILSGDAQDATEKLDSDEVTQAQENLDEYFSSCQ